MTPRCGSLFPKQGAASIEPSGRSPLAVAVLTRRLPGICFTQVHLPSA
jgi:hypothetical protein